MKCDTLISAEFNRELKPRPFVFPSWTSLIKPLSVVKRDDKVLIQSELGQNLTHDVCQFVIRLMKQSRQ